MGLNLALPPSRLPPRSLHLKKKKKKLLSLCPPKKLRSATLENQARMCGLRQHFRIQQNNSTKQNEHSQQINGASLRNVNHFSRSKILLPDKRCFFAQQVTLRKKVAMRGEQQARTRQTRTRIGSWS